VDTPLRVILIENYLKHDGLMKINNIQTSKKKLPVAQNSNKRSILGTVVPHEACNNQ